MIARGRHRKKAGYVALGTGVIAVAALTTGMLTSGSTGPARAGTSVALIGPGPYAAAAHPIGAATQQATTDYWTPARMKSATAAGAQRSSISPAAGQGAITPALSAPRGTPRAVKFNGVPTVGALFYTTGSARHFCTASTVNSAHKNLIITAAHCVYSSGYVTNVEFVPKYHAGVRPYGVWAVRNIIVASGWKNSHDTSLDFAFLQVSPTGSATRPIQQVTGGLTLGINRGYAHNPIQVIGYNDTDGRPVHCGTKSTKFVQHQMKFYCYDFWNGTSGGPWIINYNGSNGTGVVIGDIGGYQRGGTVDWLSYSPYHGWWLLNLFTQAQNIAR